MGLSSEKFKRGQVLYIVSSIALFFQIRNLVILFIYFFKSEILVYGR